MAAVKLLLRVPMNLVNVLETLPVNVPKPPSPRQTGASGIGQILLEMGELSPENLIKAIAISARGDASLCDILLANNMVGEQELFLALATQYSCDLVDLSAQPPDIRLLESVDPAYCVRHGIIPWKRVGATTLVATARPDEFANSTAKLSPVLGDMLMVLAPETAINNALQEHGDHRLALRAESRVEPQQSCRSWDTSIGMRLGAAALISLLSALILAPQITLLVLTGWALTALVFNTGLKAAAAWASIKTTRAPQNSFVTCRGPQPMMKLPKISVLVPLYHEQEIAGRLIRRLGNLNYPRELLDVCLVLEKDDTITQATLNATRLPPWIRQIVVPDGLLKTKPRALNFALDFCKGSIIAVYDAEDAPEADQLFKVARRFHESDPKVACLQGVLDFYNPRTNWLSRCFTIEYATWFRVVLPGLQRLGFVIPLGGTTIFFRRHILEELGGWDAHNVTEDADLGIRLARHGYRTELIATLTDEEANCRLWPWIQQRSRWLKGYAITWTVHMRNPKKLWQELGPWQFFGVQMLFLG